MSAALVLPYHDGIQIPTALPWGGTANFGIELEGIIDSHTLGIYSEMTARDRFLKCSRPLVNAIRKNTSEELKRLSAKEYETEQQKLGTHDRTWIVTEESRLTENSYEQGLEIISPILSGATGIVRCRSIFSSVRSTEFETPQSCGLHQHLSLGWQKGFIEGEHLQRIKNILIALQRNMEFFKRLAKPHRHDSYACMPNPHLSEDVIQQAATLKELLVPYRPLRLSVSDYLREWMFNPSSLLTHGTLEYRIKEAEGYWESLGYIAFNVCFSYEAAIDPHVRAENVVEKYFSTETPDLSAHGKRGYPRPLVGNVLTA